MRFRESIPQSNRQLIVHYYSLKYCFADTAMARVSALEEGLASAKEELVESEEGDDRQRAQRMEAQV